MGKLAAIIEECMKGKDDEDDEDDEDGENSDDNVDGGSLNESLLCTGSTEVASSTIADSESSALRTLARLLLDTLAAAAPAKIVPATCIAVSRVAAVIADGTAVTLARFAAQFCTLSGLSSSVWVRLRRPCNSMVRAVC